MAGKKGHVLIHELFKLSPDKGGQQGEGVAVRGTGEGDKRVVWLKGAACVRN